MFLASHYIITLCCFSQGYLNVNPSSVYLFPLCRLKVRWKLPEAPCLDQALYKKAASVPILTFSSEIYLLQEGELNQKTVP